MCVLILISPFWAHANNSCAQLFQISQLTLNEALLTGIVQASHKNLGDLRDIEVANIQSIVNALGVDVYITGSAAKGTRRGVGIELPLAIFGGSKKGTRSDIDYAVRTGHGDLANRWSFPEVDSSWGVREVYYINFANGPVLVFRPFAEPLQLLGEGRIYLD